MAVQFLMLCHPLHYEFGRILLMDGTSCHKLAYRCASARMSLCADEFLFIWQFYALRFLMLLSFDQVQFGHAGSCANTLTETATAKNAALKDAGTVSSLFEIHTTSNL
jgi:hypothetical protein